MPHRPRALIEADEHDFRRRSQARRDLVEQLTAPERRPWAPRFATHRERRRGRQAPRHRRPTRASRANPTGLASHTATSASASRDECLRGRVSPARRTAEILAANRRRRTTTVSRLLRSRSTTRITSPGRTCAQPAGFGMPPTIANRPNAARSAGDAEIATSVFHRVDRGSQVRLERQSETLRDGRCDVVAVGQHDWWARASPPQARSRSRFAHPGCAADREQPTRPAGLERGRARGNTSMRCPSSTTARTNASGPASLSIIAFTSTAARWAPARGLREVVDAEHVRPARARRRRTPGSMRANDDSRRARRTTPRARCSARRRGCGPRPAVIAEVPVQLLDPRLGREHERDLGFGDHRVADLDRGSRRFVWPWASRTATVWRRSCGRA